MPAADHLHIVNLGAKALADVDDTKPLQQEPAGEPDGAAVQQMVVQPASDDFADWQCVDGVWCKFEVDEDHPLRVSEHVKHEVGEDGKVREVGHVNCDEPQNDSEWQFA